jgi:gliding motility-associated-like protein
MALCPGVNEDMPGFKEDFGSVTTRVPLDPSRGTIEYQYEPTANLADSFYCISNQMRQRPEWDTSKDHTLNTNGGMLVANSSYEKITFYSRRVNGLCKGANYNFSAWFRNANGRSVLESTCRGGYIYAGVTFEILNAANNALLATFNTYDVSMPLHKDKGQNRGWQQYGGSFKTPPGVENVIVRIRNNNPGGCGNDIAIDDISFKYCAPQIYSFFDGQTDIIGGHHTMCAGAATKLTSIINPPDYFTKPKYLWEYRPLGDPNWTLIDGDVDGVTGSDSSVLVFAEDALLLQGDPNVITSMQFRLKVYEDDSLDLSSCAQPSEIMTVELLPNPRITVAGAQICLGDTAVLKACCGYDLYKWRWAMPNPTDSVDESDVDTLLVFPTTTTTYEVIGRKDYGNGRTCYRRAEADVEVYTMPTLNLALTGTSPICIGQSVTLGIDPANIVYPILWTPTGEDGVTLTHTPGSVGTHEYKVTVTNEACVAEDSINIEVLDLPDLILDPVNPSCSDMGSFNITYHDTANNPALYSIRAAGANPMPGFVNVTERALTASPINVSYPIGTAAGTYTFEMTLRNPVLDCERVKTFSVTIVTPSQPPTGIINSSPQICVSGPVTLTVDGGLLGTNARWAWYQGGCGSGSVFAYGPTVTIDPVTATTTYYVRAENIAGTCAPTICVSTTVTVFEMPANANAGPDQEHCENPNFTMAGSVPSVGQGTWSVVSAANTDIANIIIADLHAPGTTVTVPNGASAVLRWTITNGTCTSTPDEVTLINNSQPTPAAAGPDQKDCNVTSFTLAATPVTIGTGAWTTISGGKNVANANNPATTITVAPGDSIVLQWTATNGNCPPSRDTVVLVSYREPSPAVAGPDQKLCNATSFNLNATNPAVGTGRWSTIVGGKIVANAANYNTSIAVVPGDSIILVWTVSNGNCPPNTDTVTLVSYTQPTQAIAGPDQKDCNVTSFTLAANDPAIGTGLWSTIVGGKTVADATDHATTIAVVPGDSVILVWTVSNGNCTPTTDTVILVSYQQPTIAAAGPDQKDCNVTSFTLAANNPAIGTGRWSTIVGGKTVANAANYNTSIAVVPGDSIILVWTVTNGNCPPSTDTVTLVSYAQPTQAIAGPDQKDCNVTSFTLAANNPAIGTGLWSTIVGGKTVADATNPATTIAVVPGDSVILVWTVSNGNCTPTTDTVTLVSYQQPTIAAAGPDQKDCNVTSFNLSANNPAIGTGRWSTIVGGKTVANAANYNTSIAVVPGDSIILVWTVTNGNCTPSTDTVTLVSYAQPTIAAAGPDQKDCNVTSFNLSANNPAIGTGRWSTIVGGKTVADATDPATTIAVVPGDSVVLVWTISNGNCTPTTDTVTLVSYQQPTIAAAGPDQKDCNVTSFTLAANNPAIGTGRWSTIVGGKTVADATNPATTIAVVPGDSVILIWTVSNGNCTPSTDTVTLVSYQQPSIAAAGPDQKDCNVTSFTLAANNPAIGTGRWSTIVGGKTVADATDPATTIAVVPGDSVILVWSVTNGNCTPSTDTVTLVSYAQPTIAAAGPDQKDCGRTSFTMAANNPSVGTGRWSTIFGTKQVADPANPASTIATAIGDSLILVWTVTNGNCMPSTDTVTLVSYEVASPAIAGPDQKDCNVTSFTLNATAPAIGTGAWTTIVGGRTVAGVNDPATTITVAPGDSVVLEWVVTNGITCPNTRDTVTLVSYAQPTVADAGTDQRACDVTSFNLTANDPAVGTGSWSTIVGGKTVANAANYNTSITVAPGDSIVLVWTVSNGNCPPSTDTVTLVSYAQPTQAIAGPDQKDCNVTSFTLAANDPAVGTGLWSTIVGGKTVADATDPATTIAVVPGDSVMLVWTVSNGNCPPSTDTVTLVSYEQPTIAAAGPDQKDCNVTSFNLTANDPAVGTGSWSTIVGGKTVADAANYNTSITVVPGDSIVLVWTVSNGNCPPSTDTVTLVSYAQPTQAIAGPDQKDCNVTSFTLAANNPAVGTGLWSTIVGGKTVADATNPATTIAVVPGDSVILVWTVSNGNCTPTTDTVTLVSYQQPTIAAAGPDQKECNVTSFNLTANDPAVGIGSWSTIVGGRTVANAADYNTSIAVTPGDSVILVWSVSNGSCPPSTDTVTLVSYREPSPAVAGADQRLCNATSFNLNATNPAVGTGRWTTIHGGINVANPNSNATSIAVTPGDSVILVWTVSNGNCPANTDTVTLVSYAQAAPALAGPDQKACNVNTFTLDANAPSVPNATGNWSILFGTPAISNLNDPKATVTVAIGDSTVLIWNIANGACPPSTDTVILVSYQQAAIANAGPDQKDCNVSSFNLAANAPGVATATGTWAIVRGTPVISDLHNPAATATVTVGDSVVLTWTIINGACPPTTDTVVLVSYMLPSAPVAGPDQEQCNNSTFTLAATAPTSGTGSWTVVSGSATIADPSSPTSTVQVPAGMTATLRWTVANGLCPGNFDEVILSNLNPVMGNTISADQMLCPTEAAVPLGGGTITGGNGTYTYQWQSSTVSATAGFSDIPGANAATYAPGIVAQDSIWYRRIVNSGPCMNNISNPVKIIVITRPPVVVFVPGPITTNCVLGRDYTTLFGTPQFSHTPYDGLTLTITFSDATSVNGCIRTFTRTWTATDRCGMTTTASQTITVVDNLPPVFTMPKPADITVNCDAIPPVVNLTAYDSCAGNMTIVPTETRQNTPGACANNYRLIRTWTANDGCGNVANLTQIITVQDTTRPVFNMAPPKDTIVNCDAVPAAPVLTASDNCTPGVITVTATDTRQNIPGSRCADYYQIIRTWIARDECGNAATVRQTITVQDTTRPTFSIPQPANVTVDCDRVPAWPAVTATDNCSANVAVVTNEQKIPTQPACANNYRLIRTWTARDNCGNTATMQQIITVQDTTRPTFTILPPADTMVSCDAVPPPANNVTATDNCAGMVRLSRTQVRESIAGECASNYRLIRTWTAIDECGNTAVIRQVVTVRDTTAPVIAAAPADLMLNCGDAIPAPVVLNATDNCDPSFPKRVTAVEDPYVKDVCAGYTIIRRWRIADACGNQAIERVQRITVNPCPKPELDPTLPVNCSDNPRFTIQLRNRVNNPTYILVGVTPANAVQVPLSQKSNVFNLNGATQAQFIVQDGVTGCVSDTMTYNLQYSTKPMVNLGRDTTICGGNSLILDAGAANFAYTIRWSTGETTQRINVSTAGTYWVTVTNGICVTSDTIRVGLIPMPLVNLPDASICRGQSVKLDAFVDGATYLWSTGATTPSILVSTQEQFWVRVTKSACITIDTVNVTVNPPPDISLNRDTTICPDQSIMLTVNVMNGGSIRWATGATTSSIVVNEPGLYWVTVSRDNCMVRDTVNVRLQPGINVDLGPNREICPGGRITIDGTTQDAISYLWDDGDPNPVKEVSATGKYRLAVMDRFCQRVYLDSMRVMVTGTPFVNLGNDTMMCIGETLRLRADGANITSVLWSDGSTGPFLDVTRAGTYTVTVSNDCGNYTDQITVDYMQCDPKPTFPNAFSPNGDGRNDSFRPVVKGPMYEYELRIFNRWGELIYLGRDSKKGWDGRYHGEPVGVGTYVWWLTYKKMPGGNPNIIKGEVTVIK